MRWRGRCNGGSASRYVDFGPGGSDDGSGPRSYVRSDGHFGACAHGHNYPGGDCGPGACANGGSETDLCALPHGCAPNGCAPNGGARSPSRDPGADGDHYARADCHAYTRTLADAGAGHHFR